MSGTSPQRASVLAAVIAGCAVFAVALALVLGGARHERSEFDQNKFHARVIGRFADQMPRLDFRDYESATSPGYHVVLAAVRRAGVESPTGLRVVGSLFTVGLVATLAGWLAARAGTTAALALVMPMGASLYVLFPAVWLLPDNAGWWPLAALLATLLPGARQEPLRPASIVLAGSLLVLLVAARQVHAWAGLPMLVAAWLAWPASRSEAASCSLVPPVGEAGPAIARTAAMALAGLPAALLLVLLVRTWGGLVPPAFQAGGSPLTTPDATRVSGISPATPGFVLALLGLFGAFFLPVVWPRRARGWFPLAAGLGVIGVVLAALPRTNWELMGRISGLWNLVKVLPCPGDRSPLIIGLAGLGGAWIGLWAGALAPRARWVLGVSLAGFTLSQTAGALTWQRYLEPMVLMLLLLASGCVLEGATPAERRRAIAGPVALGLVQAALTAWALWGRAGS